MQKQDNITRLLIFCAGSSPELLRQCPASEWIKHTGIGMTVLITSILALASSSMALYSVFGSLWVTLPFSLLWAVLIFNIDRYIVSSFRKKGNPRKEFLQALPRLLLAMSIAIVVAKPLEMEIFRSEIHQVLGEWRAAKLESLEMTYVLRARSLDAKALNARSLLDASGKRRDRYYQEYACECDGTCGTGLRGRGTECHAKQLRYESSEQEYALEKERYEAATAAVDQERSSLSLQRSADRQKVEEEFSSGFLARLNALHSIGTLASYAITLLLLMVEASPVMAKLLGSEGPYDNLVRMSENEYRHRYMRSVYKQNLDLQSLYNASKRMAPSSLESTAESPYADSHLKYAELRRKLRTRLKNK